MAVQDLDLKTEAGSVTVLGATAGIVAGLVFAAFEMMATAVMMGWDSFFMPLRMIGAIGIGAAALDPGYPLLTAGAVGVMIHMMLSMVYGVVFAAIVSGRPMSGATIALWASLFGLALWLVNFYVIAPRMFPWFLDSNPLLQFIGHTFFFGTTLGLLVEALGRRVPGSNRT